MTHSCVLGVQVPFFFFARLTFTTAIIPQIGRNANVQRYMSNLHLDLGPVVRKVIN